LQSTLFEAIMVFAASVFLTHVLHRILAGRGILDTPNSRSSHSMPVPRGGGLSIVVTFLSMVLIFTYCGLTAPNISDALLGGGTLVAGVGFLDDRSSLPAGLRCLSHFAAAGWAIWCLQGMVPLHLGWTTWEWGWFGHLFALVSLVWMINLYNFMDGIDGLAGSEAVCVCVLGSLLIAGQGNFNLAQVALMLACACAGFLVWNWPPASIFLGDVGSGFLGFVLGVLVIASSKQQPPLIWSWLTLLAVFLVDATLTLLRRAVRGECWYEAHRTHAYQHASQLWRSHLRVTIGVAIVNVVWLFPIAWLAMKLPVIAPVLAFAALLPLIWTALHFYAGQTVRIIQEPTAKDVVLTAPEKINS
jgi:Fuc2NAc and GlcNAc transferase